MQWIVGPLKKYADFNGRASRTEFWVFLLFVTLATAAAHFADGASRQNVTVALDMGMIELSVTLLLLLPSITVGVAAARSCVHVTSAVACPSARRRSPSWYIWRMELPMRGSWRSLRKRMRTAARARGGSRPTLYRPAARRF